MQGRFSLPCAADGLKRKAALMAQGGQFWSEHDSD
jgi:hypothetical protein